MAPNEQARKNQNELLPGHAPGGDPPSPGWVRRHLSPHRSQAPWRNALEQLARNLLAATTILLAGGMPTMAYAQGPAPAVPGTGGNPAPSRAQQLMGDIAPKLAELTDEVLFGDVWERPQLSKRDRSLVTVAALVALNRPDQLRSHLSLARQNGVTEEELIEAITHLAFYSGWPNAVTAVSVAREVFKGN
jgi:4-carboxymuconolactone decarboxylase